MTRKTGYNSRFAKAGVSCFYDNEVLDPSFLHLMKFKTGLIFFFLLLFGQLAQANMASPIRRGTMTSTAFTSKDISILSEFIYIKIDKDYKTAKFIVEYTIQSEVTGRQIPLLFYAQDYKDSLFVWVDNQKVTIQDIPKEYTYFDNSPFSGFSRYDNNRENEKDEVENEN